MFVIRKGIISSGTHAVSNDVKSANVMKEQKNAATWQREVDKHFRKQTFIFILSSASHSLLVSRSINDDDCK